MGAQLMRKIKKVMDLLQVNWRTIDIGAVIFLLDQSYQGKKADLVQTVRYALHNAVRVFHRNGESLRPLYYLLGITTITAVPRIYVRVYVSTRPYLSQEFLDSSLLYCITEAIYGKISTYTSCFLRKHPYGAGCAKELLRNNLTILLVYVSDYAGQKAST